MPFLQVVALLLGVATAAPAIPCSVEILSSFHLAAKSNSGDVYPLSAAFPAIFDQAGTALRLYASIAQPYSTPETSVFSYHAVNQTLSTVSKSRSNPNGDSIVFSTPSEAAGEPVVFTSDARGRSSFFPVCGLSGTAFVNAASASPTYMLCNGDQVDQQLNRKTIYLNPKNNDPSCVSVELVTVKA